MFKTVVAFDRHYWNFADKSAGSFLYQSLRSSQNSWNISFNSNMAGDSAPKVWNTDA